MALHHGCSELSSDDDHEYGSYSIRDHHDEVQSITNKRGSTRFIGTNDEASQHVKIRMTKKQLEELAKRVDIEGLSLEQALLEYLMNVNSMGRSSELIVSSWKPVLQSIPE
ncbi:hypothetical protein Sjap_003212 [Stephania japonica]|uniref:Uncharacterized protein n=1 Tax=Stephania japonica TaxID=461633 RepID=A0AAP0KQF7_9MAGN